MNEEEYSRGWFTLGAKSTGRAGKIGGVEGVGGGREWLGEKRGALDLIPNGICFYRIVTQSSRYSTWSNSKYRNHE